MNICAFDTETTGLSTFHGARPFLYIWTTSKEFDNVKISYNKEALSITSRARYKKSGIDEGVSELKSILEDDQIIKVAHNLKFDWHMMNSVNVKMNGRLYDTMIMGHLVNENLPKSLDFMAKLYLREKKTGDTVSEWFDTKKKRTRKLIKLLVKKGNREHSLAKLYKYYDGLDRKDYSMVHPDVMIPYAKKDDYLTYNLFERLKLTISDQGLLPVLKRECKVVEVLVDMETRGVKVDIEYFKRQEKLMVRKIERIEKVIHRMAGEFNMRSGQQVAAKFTELGVDLPDGEPSPKTGKVSKKTDADTLASIDHPLAKAITAHRNASKFHTTYFVGILEKNVDGIIHPSLKNVGTVTGRFSCVSEDSLIHTSKGKKCIKDIKVGDLVLTHRGRFRRVLRVIDNGVKDTIELIWDNNKINITTNHKVLTINNEWRVINELFESNRNTTSIQIKGVTNHRPNNKKVWHELQTSRKNTKERIRGERVYHSKKTKIFGIKNRNKKPNEEQKWGETSQLQRGMLRLQGIHYKIGVWKKSIFSQASYGRGTRHKATIKLCSSSYRRGQIKQRYKQSSINDSIGSFKTSWFREEFKCAYGKKSNNSRSVKVFDLEVEHDHSFVANNIIVHNCSEPNLQNLHKGDKRVRKGFIVKDGFIDFYIDYCQMEYRVFADYCRDPFLVSSIQGGADFHQLTVDMLDLVKFFKGDQDEARKAAKIINFALLYGVGNEELSRMIGCKVAEAVKFRKMYFEKCTTVEDFMNKCKEKIAQRGYIFNRFGRRRRLGKNDAYKALNALIQGCCADIVKDVMIKVYELLIPYKSKMTLMVHDEIKVEIHESEMFLVDKIKFIMEDWGHMFIVPLNVEVEFTNTNWAHKIKEVANNG